MRAEAVAVTPTLSSFYLWERALLISAYATAPSSKFFLPFVCTTKIKEIHKSKKNWQSFCRTSLFCAKTFFTIFRICNQYGKFVFEVAYCESLAKINISLSSEKIGFDFILLTLCKSRRESNSSFFNSSSYIIIDWCGLLMRYFCACKCLWFDGSV